MGNDNYRCPICGGRLRIVNVIKVDTFRRPEATQYDLSVSRRKNKLKIPKSAAQEWMCVSCANRLPIKATPVEKAEKKKVTKEKAKTEKPLKPKKEKKKKKIDRKKRDTFFAKLFITVVVLGVIAYFGYAYSETIMHYWDKLMSIVDKVQDVVDRVASKF